MVEILYNLFQRHVQGHHAGGLKLVMVGEFTPWKSANTTDQGCLLISPRELVVKPLSAHHWPEHKWREA